MDALPNPYQVSVLLAVPLRVGQRVVGEFLLDCGSGDHIFTEQEHAIASAVGRLAGVVIERDRLLREREEARARALSLSETTEQMDAFLSIVSHELRTPVTSIKTGVQILLRRVDQLRASTIPPDDISSTLHTQQQNLRRIEKQIARLTRLLDDLIDLSRIHSGKLEVHQEACDLGTLVIEVQSGSGIGLGLGLYISKTMIERQGGLVGVESTPGEGSTFWFTFPSAPDQPGQ